METITGRVSGRRLGKNKDGADATRLLQGIFSDRRDIQNVQLVGQVGEESNPPNGSLLITVQAGPALKLAIATADRVVPALDVGGKRIYSTEGDGKTVVAEVRLDPDGAVTVRNGMGSIVISPSGAITIQAPGNMQIQGDLIVTGTIVSEIDTVSDEVSGKYHYHHEHDGGDTGPPV